MTLEARLVVERGRFRLDAALTAAAGRVVAVLGPNGAGKTTLLRALAGLVPLTAGRVTLAGRPLEDPTAGLRRPPQDRGVGVVFQDYRLFPHLTVRDNVAFGLRCRGVPRPAARARAAAELARFELSGLADARPRVLSGGQAQRVALARALAPAPPLLLLDEPLAALDASTRTRTRGELRRHLSAYAGTTLVVTHDPIEAMVLADRLVVLEGGRVTQEGPPRVIAEHPRTDYVARLVGLNLFRGSCTGNRITLASGGSLVVASGTNGEVFAAVRPAAVALHPRRPQGSPRNVWPATVTGLEPYGDAVRVLLDGQIALAADVTPAAAAELALAPGSTAWAAVKATEVSVYPA